MEKTDNKQLILSLIKDDLINTKLISGLENLGIDAGLYLLGISDSIFVLMGVEDNKQGEDLFEYYLELRQTIKVIDISSGKKEINQIAGQIYEKLINKLNK